MDANHEVVDSSGQAVKVDQVEDHKSLWDMPAMAPAKLAKLQSVTVLATARTTGATSMVSTLKVNAVYQSTGVLTLDVASGATLIIDAAAKTANLTKASGEVLDVVDHKSAKGKARLNLMAGGWGGALKTSGSFSNLNMMAGFGGALMTSGAFTLMAANNFGE